MSVWFTSDPHIGHRKVAALRGFCPQVDGPEELYIAGIREHDATLATKWDECVQLDDIVWVLGDISAGGKQAQLNALQWLSNRPGEKHLIAGNHDGCHPMYRDSHKWQLEFLKVFASVQPFARRAIAGRRALLSHFPYAGDHTIEDRYEQYRLRDCGELLLHGHVHSELKRWGKYEIHVGVDAWDFRPVRLDELAALLS